MSNTMYCAQFGHGAYQDDGVGCRKCQRERIAARREAWLNPTSDAMLGMTLQEAVARADAVGEEVNQACGMSPTVGGSMHAGTAAFLQDVVAFHSSLGAKAIRTMDWNAVGADLAWESNLHSERADTPPPASAVAQAIRGIDWTNPDDLPRGSYVMDGVTFQFRDGAVWVSAPARPTDEYRLRLAGFVAGVPLDRKVYVEYGNEDLSHLWNECGDDEEEPAPPAKPHALQRMTAMPSPFGQSMWAPWASDPSDKPL